MVAVPFTIGDGVDEVVGLRGRVSFGGASITLELHTPDASIRKVIIGVEEFATCQFSRGLLGDRLHLRASTLGALGGVPGAALDVVTLRFARRDRDAAEALATRLSTFMPRARRRASRRRERPQA